VFILVNFYLFEVEMVKYAPSRRSEKLGEKTERRREKMEFPKASARGETDGRSDGQIGGLDQIGRIGPIGQIGRMAGRDGGENRFKSART
jgi:hypothetical protein